MRKLSEALYAVAVSLWVGSLWTVGGLVAPILFAQLADRSLAGKLAGALFTAQAWVGVACAAYLLLFLGLRRGPGVLKSGVFWLVLAMLALTLAGHFGIQPILAQLKQEAWPRNVMESVMRDRFLAWHGVSSGLYLIECLLGLWLMLWQERR
ncbi:MAG TPA: DUF4149 domain-containing protein [Rhodocyclaceae bacterium]|nr:DUF4149 domain-containing protein [Rhodocyclaceae bacterium]